MLTRPCAHLLKLTSRLGLAAALIAALSGCASFNRIADYPTPRQPVAIAVVAKPMSKMNELPIGAYYDEPRQIIVTGHQKGLFAGMLFGVVGVIVADQMNKSSGASQFGDDAARSSGDLGAMLREAIDTAVRAGTAATWTHPAADAKVRLSPYAVFTVEKSGQARLYAMLRAEILGADGVPTWSARYFARAPGLHPLDGTDTWMNDGRFVAGMQTALARALDACIADTQGRFASGTPTLAKGRFAYINSELELPFLLVEEQADWVVGRLAAGDVMVLAGTHVLDRADYTFKPGKFKDPRK